MLRNEDKCTVSAFAIDFVRPDGVCTMQCNNAIHISIFVIIAYTNRKFKINTLKNMYVEYASFVTLFEFSELSYHPSRVQQFLTGDIINVTYFSQLSLPKHTNITINTLLYFPSGQTSALFCRCAHNIIIYPTPTPLH